MNSAEKKQIIDQLALKKGDTGSPEVQVGIITKKIQHLTEHLKKNHGDEHSRYGMKKLISQRKKLLTYLKRVSTSRYLALIKTLMLRR